MGGSSSKTIPTRQEILDPTVETRIPKKVYFDMATGTIDRPVSVGRINMLLYQDTPKTSRNFGLIAAGVKGKNGDKLSYQYNSSHRTILKFMIQMGDIHHSNLDISSRGRPGTGGESIYGGKFADENFTHQHHIGALSMANAGPNTNGSQFFICTNHCTHLNGKHVVFGKVEEDSMPIVQKIESFGSQDGTPKTRSFIADCGVLEWY